MGKSASRIESWAIGLAAIMAAAGFGYWLAVPYWRAPAPAVESNVAGGGIQVSLPQPQVTEPTGPPPTVSPDSAANPDHTYAPPTGQPSNGR